MPLSIAFWVLMLLWLAFGLWWGWPNHGPVGSTILLFLLFAILGWKVFGSPIQ